MYVCVRVDLLLRKYLSTKWCYCQWSGFDDYENLAKSLFKLHLIIFAFALTICSVCHKTQPHTHSKWVSVIRYTNRPVFILSFALALKCYFQLPPEKRNAKKQNNKRKSRLPKNSDESFAAWAGGRLIVIYRYFRIAGHFVKNWLIYLAQYAWIMIWSVKVTTKQHINHIDDIKNTRNENHRHI